MKKVLRLVAIVAIAWAVWQHGLPLPAFELPSIPVSLPFSLPFSSLTPEGRGEGAEQPESAPAETAGAPVGVVSATPAAAASQDEGQREFADRLERGLSDVSATIDVSGLGVGVEDGVEAYKQVLARHPEMFWTSGGCSYTYDDTGLLTLSPDYLYDASSVPAMRASYEDAAERAVRFAGGAGSDADKAKALHDYLVENSEYSRTAIAGGEVAMVEHTAYGALVNGESVCDGYARAYQDLLGRVGITSVVVESRPMYHAWNMVSLGGSWYHVDVTYDDPIIWDASGSVVHSDDVRADYFLKSDAYMQANKHYGWTTDLKASDTSLDGKTDWKVFRG